MLNVAFKEWAAVCRALAEGRQGVILRKGGIAEVGGEFRPEHDRFWLYPTYFHEQQRTGLKPEFLPLIDAAEVDRPPAGELRLTHFVEVSDVRFVDRLEDALALDPLHVWSEEMVRQRFHYRTPGLYILNVRVYRARTPVELTEDPAYAGCKTWVELDRDVEEQPADPVLP
ncbi:MAG TPA: DUF1802 family protein [Fimbriiglobus sp.]|jgi:hypothetical protein|nr:DUF1802 family protein [Fimbriiglobus sp.]